MRQRLNSVRHTVRGAERERERVEETCSFSVSELSPWKNTPSNGVARTLAAALSSAAAAMLSANRIPVLARVTPHCESPELDNVYSIEC